MSKSILFFLIVFLNIGCSAQEETKFRVAFYNVENLFDIYDDSLCIDEEFLPDGAKFWTERKYNNKLGAISKTIVGIGAWQNIGLLALAEIENRQVLEDLISRPELKKQGLRILHKQSPDRRGIDVGILYDPKQITVTHTEFVKVMDHTNLKFKTRDMVYLKGSVFKKGEIHFFACHWPSRYGGQARSEPKRILAATILRAKIDSIQKTDPLARIIVMGDFNDEWNNKSLKYYLKAIPESNTKNDKQLLNLMCSLPQKLGSHKYQGEWAYLDQIIVNQRFAKNDSAKMYISDFGIINLPFLVEEDVKYLGLRPKRTYIGYKYHGGFSDHLPIYLDIVRKPDHNDKRSK